MATSSSDVALTTAIDVLLRLAYFYTRYASQILAQRAAIEAGEITQVDAREFAARQRLKNTAAIDCADDEIGSQYDMLYGLGELRSPEEMRPGNTLIISANEQYNGCEGWFAFGTVLKPPFITVARTGRIGESFIHLEPCAPTSDCLVLIPRPETVSSPARLLLAAAAIRLGHWRSNYDHGRKITPRRLANIKLSHSNEIETFMTALFKRFSSVIEASLDPYRGEARPARAEELARRGVSDIASSPEALAKRKTLRKKLNRPKPPHDEPQ